MAEIPAIASDPGPQLPKLSPNDFRVYNRMAEHMEYFVSGEKVINAQRLNGSARPLPPDLDGYLHSMFEWQASSQYLNQAIPCHGSAIL